MKILSKKTLLKGLGLTFLFLNYSIAHARGNDYYVNFMNNSDLTYEVVRVDDYCAYNLPSVTVYYKKRSEHNYGFDANDNEFPATQAWCRPGFTLLIKPEGSTATPAKLIVDTNRSWVKLEKNGHNLSLDRTTITKSSHPWISMQK